MTKIESLLENLNQTYIRIPVAKSCNYSAEGLEVYNLNKILFEVIENVFFEGFKWRLGL